MRVRCCAIYPASSGFCCPARAIRRRWCELVGDEQTLKKPSCLRTAPALSRSSARGFHQTPTGEHGGAVRRLGDDSFEVREQATRGPAGRRRAAGPLLQVAVNDADAEIARRAGAVCKRLIFGAPAPTEARRAQSSGLHPSRDSPFPPFSARWTQIKVYQSSKDIRRFDKRCAPHELTGKSPAIGRKFRVSRRR